MSFRTEEVLFMCKLRFILLIFFSVVLSGSAFELRTWEDTDGNQFEGRFLRELFGKLTIESEDGSTKVFRLENLSELDQKYLRVMVPPKIEANVKVQSAVIPPLEEPFIKKDLENQKHKAVVSITKKSQRPFTSRLRGEIFLIAQEVEASNYVLLNRTEVDFLLPSVSKGAEVTFESTPAKTVIFRDTMSSAMKGEESVGYLLVISTLQGETVLMDSNLPSWIEDENVIENLRDLAIRGAASVCSRHFDKTGKKIPPPRPAQRGPTAP